MQDPQNLMLSQASFNREIIDAGRPGLVGFWAEWCSPCRSMGEIFASLEKTFEGRAVIGCVDIDEEADLAESCGVNSVPALLLFQSGVVVKRLHTALPEVELEALVLALLPN